MVKSVDDRGRGARLARRDEAAYRGYVTEPQRSKSGCIGCEGDRLDHAQALSIPTTKQPLRWLVLTALACHALACSSDGQGGRAPASVGGGAADADADAPIVPTGLTVLALSGGNGVLDLIALTLRQGERGIEVYAALRNHGDIPACHALLSLELYDNEQASLAVGTGGLPSAHFYRLDDGSGTLAVCVAPGEVTLAAITDFPQEISSDAVGYIVYRCPYFALSVVPTEGLSVSGLKREATSSSTIYTGTFVNGLDVTVKEPSVVVFPLSRSGRPLGAVTSGASFEIPPGRNWAFEVSASSASLDAAAVDQIVFPEASFAN